MPTFQPMTPAQFVVWVMAYCKATWQRPEAVYKRLEQRFEHTAAYVVVMPYLDALDDYLIVTRWTLPKPDRTVTYVEY